MSINTNISFSQFVGQHLNSSSGFNIQDYIYECVDNSFDANSTNIVINFIKKPCDLDLQSYYLVIADNGSGSDTATKFFSVGDSIIKKENKIGCKNTGFLASLITIKPICTWILTKVIESKNIKTLKYYAKKHLDKFTNFKKYDNDYRKIDIEESYLEPDVSGEINEIIEEFYSNSVVSQELYDIFKQTQKMNGTIIISEITKNSFDELNNLINPESQEYILNVLALKSPKINNINFYVNNEFITKPEYVDILNTNFEPYTLDITVKQFESKYLFLISPKTITKEINPIIKYYNGTNMNKIIPKETEQFETIGTFTISFCFLSQNYYDKKPSPLAHIKNSQKRSLIYDLGNSRFFTESKENSDSNSKNGGPFLLFIKPTQSIKENFYEENLGIRNNKRLSSINYMSTPIKKFIEKIKKILVENISHYNIYGELGKYLKISDYKAEGITSWLNYENHIIKLLDDEVLNYNIHIQVFNEQNKVISKQKELDVEPVYFNVNYKIYYEKIKFEFEFNGITKIVIKTNGKDIQISPTKNKTIENLKSDIFYNFEIYGITTDNLKTPIKIFNNLKPNIKLISDVPTFNVYDETHNIKIEFIKSDNYGLPIQKILVKYGNDKIPEEHEFSNTIILKKQLHFSTQIKVAFKNEVGVSKYKSVNVKNKSCERKHFTTEQKISTLEKYNHKCAISNIQLNEQFNRYEFDHKDGLCCNNSTENCQPLLVEIHNIKTNNPKYFEKIISDKKELDNWKLQKIMSIQNSISK